MQKCCLELCATAAPASCLERTTCVLEQKVNLFIFHFHFHNAMQIHKDKYREKVYKILVI